MRHHRKFIDCYEIELQKVYLNNYTESNKKSEEKKVKRTLDAESNKRMKNIFNLKRNGADQEEIVSFFRNAIAKNMRLKSNIKTTRF